jgi:hypothetical protein
LAGGYIKLLLLLLLLLLLFGYGRGFAVFFSAANAAGTQPPGGFVTPDLTMCSRHSAATPDTYGHACVAHTSQFFPSLNGAALADNCILVRKQLAV